jgi:hypothetical protein
MMAWPAGPPEQARCRHSRTDAPWHSPGIRNVPQLRGEEVICCEEITVVRRPSRLVRIRTGF